MIGHAYTAIDFAKFLDPALKACAVATGKTQISDLTQLACYNLKISDASGIEQLTALTDLDLGGNQLSEIDLSKNTALSYLDLYGNRLLTADISANRALTYLDLYCNQLSSLDVPENTLLTELFLDGNFLSCDYLESLALRVTAVITTEWFSSDASDYVGI